MSSHPQAWGTAEKCSSEEESSPWKKRASDDAKRGAHYVYFSDSVSGLENMPQREGIMKGLKFQTPSASRETGVQNKAMSVSSLFPPPLLTLAPLALEPPEAPGLASGMEILITNTLEALGGGKGLFYLNRQKHSSGLQAPEE